MWERIEQAAKADDAARGFLPTQDSWQNLGDVKCESPIERQLQIGLEFFGGKWGYEIIPQFALSRYRYDFAVKNKATGKIVAVIECDGRAFHSTEKQLANDAEKDRIAAQAGYRIFRRRGDEIWRNPTGCAEQIIFELYPS